ncbi:MAG: hypothetical protein CVV23_13825 [Ignavibacteriae bacterium HGW-Ignavibacteriae-2]|jgi:glycerophosphoryl diester phosphodiesterase|nr:MAG: hypothetical protein CVV23_13825 [Ignavibacteriae bacterium HGW-Ignavibacteriae-2]
MGMKDIYVKIYLFDPVTDEEFFIGDSVSVEIIQLLSYNPAVGINSKILVYDKKLSCYKANLKNYEFDNSYYFRVGFMKRNFSKVLNKLIGDEEVNLSILPSYIPSRIPYWDSGWDDDYESNEFFGDGYLKVNCSKENPIKLRIPLREFYIIGHRGAPYHYPENTMASFKHALSIGANALEMDVCFTKDKKLVVFHDAYPTKHPNQLDRTLFEDLPYELISPVFMLDGKQALIMKYKNGKLKQTKKIKLKYETDFDIANLTLAKINEYYGYKSVDGEVHGIINFNEFLNFASSERDRLKLIFFDVKNPRWDVVKDSKKYAEYGTLLAEAIKQLPELPEHLIISNPDKDVLKLIKESFSKSGENRCSFAFDAEGSFGAYFGVKENPLSIARKMDNEVVSIGSLARPGNLNEIKESVRDRDYNYKSKIKMVVHWTINEKALMATSIISGVNGIITDKPDLLKKMLMESFKVKVS